MKLITMPHTGTVFTRYVLKCFGLRDERENTVGEYMSHHTNEFDEGLTVGEEQVVVPLRDPMLAEISRINRGWGMPVHHWDRLLPLFDLPDTHAFRVQLPSGVTKADELGRLAEFLDWQSDLPHVDWTPRNARPGDPGRLKWKYSRGEIDEKLRPAWSWLRGHPALAGVFRSHGYDLGWMR